MVDLQKVCSMCGDVGFPEKLFRCSKCRHRYQHSYCSNYYSEMSEVIEVCDWCQSEERSINSTRRGSSSRKSPVEGIIMSSSRSEYPGGDHKIKHQNHDHHREDQSTAHDQKPKNNHGGAPSPRTPTRRYKLLKDVMC
ncbi:hypothetical protein CQW23_03056 [Capsicum baccatum]|uniref:PHD-type zinc finger plants domain-containing protein n=1 Tax=Capsicum baccatum TaxID=33114 RepID=A0A2G2XT85_CAPBA|nr:hypothetical protein CQW23_03056 [Capsicum baccatum]